MLVVKDIKVSHVDRDQWYVNHYKEQEFAFLNPAAKVHKQEITTEMVRGRSFFNVRGEEFCIGMTKQVQDAIGLPFEDFENKNALIEELRSRLFEKDRHITRQTDTIIKMEQSSKKEIDDLVGIIFTYESMSFWKRLKFLFKLNKR